MKALFGQEAVTRDITVRVSVSYLSDQSEPGRGRWFWAYHIRIENDAHQAVQLLSRRWTITDGRGSQHMVEGEGVVGEQPMIAPGSSYDYVSGCPLATRHGRMEGRYKMMAEDGSRFSIDIPAFVLELPGDRPAVH